MKKLICMFLALFSLISCNTPIKYVKLEDLSSIYWHRGNQESFDESKKFQKDVLIYFSLEQCGYCKMMQKTTLQDPIIIKTINTKFIPISISSLHPEFDAYCEKYNVNSFPAIVILRKHNFVEIVRVDGYVDNEDLFKYLQMGLSLSGYLDEHDKLNNTVDDFLKSVKGK